MPSKPKKYGLKLWVACDAKTSYAWKMSPYLGKVSGIREKTQAARVSPYLGKVSGITEKALAS